MFDCGKYARFRVDPGVEDVEVLGVLGAAAVECRNAQRDFQPKFRPS